MKNMAQGSQFTPIRLHGIKGYENRCNDLIHYPSNLFNESADTVIFFPGDVQDYIENMESHRDNKHYKQWNLEETASLLHNNFGGLSHILVVKPSRMEIKTFSCYDNFVSSNNCGVPEHSNLHYGLSHLEMLLSNTVKELQSLDDSEGKHMQENPGNNMLEKIKKGLHSLENNKVTLVGFSKGCVVLNQFIYEFNYYKTNPPQIPIIERIKHMYWLDGGHCGGKNTWITSPSLLKVFLDLDIQVHIHVTPYQIKDERRPWIRKEEKFFSDTLVKLGVNLERKVHFQDSIPSLQIHFDILKKFKNSTS